MAYMWLVSLTFQALSNVTVPGPENCTSVVFCWLDGNETWTLMNVSETIYLERCMCPFQNLKCSLQLNISSPQELKVHMLVTYIGMGC